jgi:mannose-6-phosphate isomerase-like protein (cupin superfamily)
VTDQEPVAVDFRRLEHENMVRAYGLEMKLLHPWDGLTAPFEGAWCVLRPGDTSVAHAHHEHEIFIGISGNAIVEADGEQRPFAAGDIAFFPPGVRHRVHNPGRRPFEMYSVWWDTDMAARFAAMTER